MLLTFEEYAEALGVADGHVDVDNFDDYLRDAEAELHLATFDRLRPGLAALDEDTQTRVKAALIDLIYYSAQAEATALELRANPIVTDERVGDWSVKYKAGDGGGAAAFYGGRSPARIIARHLLHTGLLYRGDYEGGLPTW